MTLIRNSDELLYKWCISLYNMCIAKEVIPKGNVCYLLFTVISCIKQMYHYNDGSSISSKVFMQLCNQHFVFCECITE